jgi:hypothetical protein
MPFTAHTMAWSDEHRALVVEEFIQNGGSPIMTQRFFKFVWLKLRTDINTIIQFVPNTPEHVLVNIHNSCCDVTEILYLEHL